MSGSDNVNNVYEHVQEIVEEGNVGARSYDRNISLEQVILNLTEITEFIHSKNKVMKISDTSKNEDLNLDSVDIKLETMNLIKDVSKSDLEDDIYRKVVLSSVLNAVLINSSEDIDFNNYKQKVIKQLEILKNTSRTVLQLCTKQADILNETIEVQMQIISETNNCKNKLTDDIIEYKNKCQESLPELYKEQMKKIELRINKINFIISFISKLLIFTNVNFENNSEFRELLKACRSIFTKQSFMDK